GLVPNATGAPGLSVIAVATALALGPGAASAQGLDGPMLQAWPAVRAWTPVLEAEFGAFVAAIGRAVAAGRCHRLQRCLNDRTINPLWEPGARRLHVHADCADVPYLLRAYFSYRHGLPFAYTARLRGRGRNPRYLSAVRPEGLRRWVDFRTPR